MGHKALAVQCDIASFADAEKVVKAAVEAFGSLQILVNNAGMSPIYDNVAEVSEALYDKVLEQPLGEVPSVVRAAEKPRPEVCQP